MNRGIVIISTLLLASSAAAGGSVYYEPPVTVYPQLPPYYQPPPPPFVAIGNAIGGLISLPFQLIGGIGTALTTPFQYPQAAMVPDGIGGQVPNTNSSYDPGTGQFMPHQPQDQPQVMPGGQYPSITPIPEQRPAYYDPRPHVHHAPRRPEQHEPWQWHDPNPSPERLPDTREWKEPNGHG